MERTKANSKLEPLHLWKRLTKKQIKMSRFLFILAFSIEIGFNGFFQPYRISEEVKRIIFLGNSITYQGTYHLRPGMTRGIPLDELQKKAKEIVRGTKHSFVQIKRH